MKLTKFFKEQVDKWNCEKKCGQCFEFHAPLTESALNKQQFKDVCCVQVLLTRDVGNAFGIDRTYNNNLGVIADEWEYKNFRLYFLVKRESLGINNHTEILGHSLKGTNSEILEDLEQCIIDMNLDFCEFIGQNWNVTQWNAQQLINYQSDNFTGYRLTVTIRKRKK